MKYFLEVIILCISITTFSQETVLSFKNDLKTSSSDIKDVIPVVNSETDEIAFFVADAKNVYGYKIDANFKVLEKITSEEKRRKYKVLIGSSASKNDSYRVFLTNKNQTDFAFVNFSFKEGSTSFKEFSIDQNETFLQTVNSKNQFYLISGSTLKNELYIYTFDEDGNPLKNNIDISSLRFISSRGKNAKLLSLLVTGDDLTKFEENTPNSIELTSQETKMFVREDSFFITLDHHKMFTQVLEINLNTFKADSFQFNKPSLGEKAKRTNSYVNGKNIFTIAVTKDEFSVEILNFETGDLLKEYSANKNDSITFKNTAIIQEGGMYDSYRELGKTNRFLRRISKGNSGISARKVNNQYHVIIGGYIVQKSNAGMMMPFGGIPIGSIGSATVFFNPAQIAFNSFSNNKTTRIESLLDENFNHLEGEIKENAFDKMKEFKSNNKGSTVFKYKDFYIKTEYMSFSKDFIFRKFTD
ncbi:hypothetical protein [uncultured Polaribacter sp.]|uniref:hypothetical protein n=1 Tax=uncultured Polaribacter sp. TaxID=174711 RepID=UPI0030DB6C57|tara:strand:+ start:1575 stop:2987 length:1413 start_codon:yes stop_codon:yes gene_type:complete